MAFDAKAAKLLTQGQHLTVDGCPGLRLEATKTQRTWIYRYRSPVDKRLRQTKLGSWPAMSLAGAMGAWEQARKAREGGADLAEEKRSAREAERAAAAAKRERRALTVYTVRRLCDDYLQQVDRSRKERGAKEVRRMFDTMLGELARVPAVEVTRTMAFDLLDSHAHIPVQAGKLRAELGAAWDYALDAGRLPESASNWWRQIKRGKLKSKGKKIQGEHIGTEKRVLTAKELGELLRWLPNFSRSVCDALTLYLWTGTRGAEIMAMEADEITEEDDGLWWTVPKRKTKNARLEIATDLRVPLMGRAEEIVRRRKQAYPGTYLFPSKGRAGYMEQKAIQTAVYYHMPYSMTAPGRLRPGLTVTRWAPHDLRRTVRTMLAALGCPNDLGEVVLGHVLPGGKGVYNRHTYDKERREWLSLLSTRLEQLASHNGGL